MTATLVVNTFVVVFMVIALAGLASCGSVQPATEIVIVTATPQSEPAPGRYVDRELGVVCYYRPEWGYCLPIPDERR